MGRTYYRYVGVYTFTYFALASFLPFLAKYLGNMGYTETQIGTVAAVGSLAGLVSRPLMGIVVDKTLKNKEIILALIGISMIFAAVMYLAKDFLLVLTIYTVMLFFLSPVNTLIDATALGSHHGFGKLRQWGAYGFAFGSLITGIIASQFGIQVIFLVFVGANTISLLSFRKITIKRNIKKTNTYKGIHLLLQNKRYLLFVLCAIFMHGTITANNTYFGPLYTTAGGTIAGIGVAFFLFAGSEAPFMSLSDRILKKVKLEDLILISILISILKLYWYSYLPSPLLLVVTFFIHGISTGFYIVASIKFINENTRPELTATALSLYASIGTGLSTVLCNYLGGVVADHYGIIYTYKLFAAFATIALIIMLIIKKVKPINVNT